MKTVIFKKNGIDFLTIYNRISHPPLLRQMVQLTQHRFTSVNAANQQRRRCHSPIRAPPTL